MAGVYVWEGEWKTLQFMLENFAIVWAFELEKYFLIDLINIFSEIFICMKKINISIF